MSEQLWNLPSKPGTVIEIGEWRLIRLEPYEGASSAWELLPASNKRIQESFDRLGITGQTVYSDEWVLAEADQEGGYFVIAEPCTPYGPTMRGKVTHG
jgi:hypothetical protein